MADDYLEIGADCRIRLDDIEWRFSASGGPGGQHVNRTSTKAEARLDLDAASTLTDAQRDRLRSRLGDVVSVTASDTRSQARNREIALERLERRLADALRPKKRRRKTRPTRASQRRRVEGKRRRSDVKKKRRKPRWD